LQSPDEQELRSWSETMLAALRKRPELTDVTTNQHDLGQQMMITVDRNAAARFGLSVSAVDADLYDAFGQRQISTIYSQTYQYKVVLEVAPEYRNTAEALDSLYLTKADALQPSAAQSSSGVSGDFSNSAEQIPLRALARMEKRVGPLAI